MAIEQDIPNTVKIEMTEGCNLQCSFCGLSGIREKPGNFKFLTAKLAEKMAKQIADAGWERNTKIEFTMHGEPLLNPDADKIVAVFRKHLPRTQLMVTTNSLALLKSPGMATRLQQLFDAGLNILAVDKYATSKKAWEQIYKHRKAVVPEGVEVYDYPGPFAPNLRHPRNTKAIIMMEDIGAAENSRVGSRKLSNHLGAAAPVDDSLPYMKRCARPFRELAVRWNGKVALCCNDWRGEYKCGDANKESLADIWQNEFFLAARKMLYASRRDFKPCDKCDNISYRVGILPDKLGKKTLPKPDKKTAAILQEAVSGRTYTKAVIRPWEIKRK